MELTARLPWWVGVSLAVLAYLMLNYFATREVTAPKDLQAFGWGLTGHVWRALAFFGQYVVPIAFLAGAAVSLVKRRQRKNLFNSVAQAKHADAFNRMTWQQFETSVAEAFERKGYAVTARGGSTADGGIDVVLRRGNEKAFIQCKQWRAMKVGVQTVRELYGVMAAEGASHGFVATSGRFTADARQFAEGRNIELLDGGRLLDLFGASHEPQSGAASASTDASKPACPKCAKPMVRRTAKRGANAGTAFWGCVAYPQCNGTRQLDG